MARVVSLTVHKNTIANRRRKNLRCNAQAAIRQCVEDMADADAFFIVVMHRSGEYRAICDGPGEVPPAIWAGMVAEAASQAIE